MKKISVLLVIFTLFVVVTGASAKSTYTVKKGDNLYDIARKFNISVNDIEKTNKVSAKTLKPGKKIVIPEKEGKSSKAARKVSLKEKTTVETSSNPAKLDMVDAVPSGMPSSHEKAEKEPDRSVKADEETDKYHTIKKGDTLKSITKKYKVSESDIRNLNELHSAKLRTGQKLLVKLQGPKTYVVKKGDNLWRIAKKFDMDADDLMEINEMSSPALKAGRKLYLEEKPEVVNVDQKYLIMAKNIEEELKKVPESPEFAEQTIKLLQDSHAAPDQGWGLDHGTWSVLVKMFPDAQIPVYQLSIDYSKPPEYHFNLMKELRILRTKGVLMMGSGNMVHNLSMVQTTSKPYDWNIEFDSLMTGYINNADYQSVVNFQKTGKLARLAHPSYDHFLPLLCTLGMADKSDQVTYFNEGFELGSLSMRSLILTGS